MVNTWSIQRPPVTPTPQNSLHGNDDPGLHHRDPDQDVQVGGNLHPWAGRGQNDNNIARQWWKSFKKWWPDVQVSGNLYSWASRGQTSPESSWSLRLMMMMMMTKIIIMDFTRSVGICILELAEGKPPLSHLHPMRALMQVNFGKCNVQCMTKYIRICPIVTNPGWEFDMCSYRKVPAALWPFDLNVMFHKEIADFQNTECTNLCRL